jgi:ABC-2 type transport system ATP-binding protein
VLLTLAEAGDTVVAVKALQPFAAGSIVSDGSVSGHGGRLLEVPVIATDGLATEVLRALDAAGVGVSDIAVRSASLDDVFLTLTGHAAEAADEDDVKAELAEEAAV